MVKKIDNIWYEFISPNNIPMVCLGKYNWELIDGYGWNSTSENFDGNIVFICMTVGNLMNHDHSNRLEYKLVDDILSIDGCVDLYCKIVELDSFVDRIRQANSWNVPPLYSEKPKGLDRYIRLQKLNKLRNEK